MDDVVVCLRSVGRQLDDPGVDVDAGVHREALMTAFAEAGSDRDLAEALYAVESDTSLNPFAVDVAPPGRAA